MIYDLMPRLITHHESQIAYYERQIEASRVVLARLALKDQLQFDYASGETLPDLPQVKETN